MRDERGLTLIELLAAISILFIISATIYGVFFGFNKNYNQISDKNSMDQNANVVLAVIKQYHQNNDQYLIRYDDAKKAAYIGIDAADNLLGDSRFDMEMRIGYPDYTVPEDFSGELTIQSTQPIAVQIRLQNTTGQSYEIETIIKRY